MTPTTTWQRVALDIVRKIRSGETPLGDKIPSYRRLAVEHRTSINTVKQAIKYLQDQGVIKGMQGSGLFVVQVPEDEPTFAPAPTEDVTGRVADLEEGQRDVRERIGALEAAVDDLYAKMGRHRQRAADARKPPRKAANG